MEHDFSKIFTFLKSESLSENERIQMRNVLHAVMREHPARAPRTYAARASRVLQIFESHYVRTISFALVFVIVIGVGTSYAAEGALPGDPLYAFKTRVSEPIQGALAVTPVAKAQWNTELVSRRLEEAAQLAVKGKLDNDTRAEIESNLSLSAKGFAASVQQIQSGNDTVAAASAQSDLEASLIGHEHVLTALSADLPAQAPTIAPLLQTVRVQEAETGSGRKTSEDELGNQDQGTIRAAAAVQRQNAHDKVREIRALAQTKRLQASTTAEASTSAADINAAIDAGDQKLQEGKYKDAFSTFQAAIRAARAVEVNLNADEQLTPEVDSRRNTGGDDGGDK